MADFAIGVTASAAFWRDLEFKAAAVFAASIFLLGDAFGHIREILLAGNFSPWNAGVPFYMDVACPLLVAPSVAHRPGFAGRKVIPSPIGKGQAGLGYAWPFHAKA